MILSLHKGVILSCLFMLGMLAPAHLMYGQKVTRIEILNAELTAYDQVIGKGARKLLGDVRLKHDDVVMFCDSA